MTHANAQLPSEPLAAPLDAFRFGRNWQRYVSGFLDADRERIALESLHQLVGDLRGKTFLDIGSGSGLFSLCAFRSGARQVVSVDVDPDAVDSTAHLRARAGSPENWRVLNGSILDARLLTEVDPAEVVYAWGVLHHTGDMYAAIANAAQLVKPGGRFAIAIYNRDTSRWLNSERWWRIKRAYNHAPRAGQRMMEAAYAAWFVAERIRGRQNPIRIAREYRQERGMALWTDLVDWLGGYPYEFASATEIIEFCESSCELRCLALHPVPFDGTGNNEFVFERPVR